MVMGEFGWDVVCFFFNVNPPCVINCYVLAVNNWRWPKKRRECGLSKVEARSLGSISRCTRRLKSRL
jgi:hypothetical protein